MIWKPKGTSKVVNTSLDNVDGNDYLNVRRATRSGRTIRLPARLLLRGREGRGRKSSDGGRQMVIHQLRRKAGGTQGGKAKESVVGRFERERLWREKRTGLGFLSVSCGQYRALSKKFAIVSLCFYSRAALLDSKDESKYSRPSKFCTVRKRNYSSASAFTRFEGLIQSLIKFTDERQHNATKLTKGYIDGEGDVALPRFRVRTQSSLTRLLCGFTGHDFDLSGVTHIN